MQYFFCGTGAILQGDPSASLRMTSKARDDIRRTCASIRPHTLSFGRTHSCHPRPQSRDLIQPGWRPFGYALGDRISLCAAVQLINRHREITYSFKSVTSIQPGLWVIQKGSLAASKATCGRHTAGPEQRQLAFLDGHRIAEIRAANIGNPYMVGIGIMDRFSMHGGEALTNFRGAQCVLPGQRAAYSPPSHRQRGRRGCSLYWFCT